ncbi:hypothetical protein [Kutzneria sp. 744]|uniref:hypothetical protein n=1 Tax=Kutzneria sp. (strain 744) TaxID=345341 RepID=UPI0018DC205E|nr:hypothetical protein [Kutzneria sp. 744]
MPELLVPPDLGELPKAFQFFVGERPRGQPQPPAPKKISRLLERGRAARGHGARWRCRHRPKPATTRGSRPGSQVFAVQGYIRLKFGDYYGDPLQLSRMPRASTFHHDVSDPGRAQRNRLERDSLVTLDAVESARRLGVRVIEVDGSRDAEAEAEADEVGAHLGL